MELISVAAAPDLSDRAGGKEGLQRRGQRIDALLHLPRDETGGRRQGKVDGVRHVLRRSPAAGGHFE